MSSSPKRRAVLYLAAAFVVGLLAGAVVGFAFAWAPPPASPERMAEHIRTRLTSELRLTEAQRRQIAPIVDDLVREMGAEHQRTVARMVQIIRQSHQRMEPYLTAEQSQKFRRIQQEREAAFRRAARAPR
jgi:Spy/CpxP family protein refolding chaperone